MGLVYILTNPCLDGWVKIGMTDRNSVDERLNELNNSTSIPLSFRCYATYKVERNSREVEQSIHKLIDMIDGSLHARETLKNGKIREREFFKISAEKAFGIFSAIAALRGDSNNLRLFEPTEENLAEENFAEKTTTRKRTTFEMLGIRPGENISYLYNNTIKAIVIDTRNQVEYNGIQYSVTALARRLQSEHYGWQPDCALNGWTFFTYNGQSLYDLRLNRDADDENSDDNNE